MPTRRCHSIILKQESRKKIRSKLSNYYLAALKGNEQSTGRRIEMSLTAEIEKHSCKA